MGLEYGMKRTMLKLISIVEIRNREGKKSSDSCVYVIAH